MPNPNPSWQEKCFIVEWLWIGEYNFILKYWDILQKFLKISSVERKNIILRYIYIVIIINQTLKPNCKIMIVQKARFSFRRPYLVIVQKRTRK